MLIAFPTDDGVLIHRHFGQAPQYAVFTVENGAAIRRELRDKEAHRHGHAHDHAHHHEHEHADDHDHGHDHNRMFAPITDCQVLIAGGMGRPALAAAEASGLAVILTTEHAIEPALQAYLAGALIDHRRLAHTPGRHHD